MSKLQEALKITGYVLCEFKSAGDECDTCDKEIAKGADVYYERTSWECDEGNYHCTECTLAEPEKWAVEADAFDKWVNEQLQEMD